MTTSFPTKPARPKPAPAKASRPDANDRTVASNRRARHDYEILETLEAGLVLMGSEIKSIRAGQISLQEAYVNLMDGEAWLVGCHIAEYAWAGYAGHAPLRNRKLLLHRKQIFDLKRRVQTKGITLIPLRLYLTGGRAKLEIGLGRGKKQLDKRETLKERDVKRDIDRELARRER